MASITKAVIGEQDLQKWDGVTSTFTRDTSTGSTLTLRKIGGEVDALAVYGAGVTFTNATITSALTAIGTTNKVSLILVPGTWVISANVDWSAYTNVTFKILPGALLSHSTYTMKIPNPSAGDFQWLSGTGLVTFSGVVDHVSPYWFGSDGTAFTKASASIVTLTSAKASLLRPSTDYYYSTNTLAATNYYLDMSDAFTVTAAKEVDVNRIDLNSTIGAAGTFAANRFHLKSLVGSGAGSNMYGMIGYVYNYGAGTTKALYGRVAAQAGCTGDIVGLVTGVETVAGMGNSAGLQMGIHSDGGLPVGYNYGIWLHIAAGAALGELSYGLLFDNITITAGGAFIQGNAKGTGDFLRLKNSAADADLFAVNSLGKISVIAGVSATLAMDSQIGISFSNTTRIYSLQAVTTGDYFRIIVGGVADGFILDHHLNTGLAGYAGNFSDGTKILGLAQVGVAPTGNPVGGVFIYWDGTNLKLRKADGTVQTVTVS